MRMMTLLLCLSCASDIAIITTEQKRQDTAETIGVGEPADDPWNPDDTDTQEPSDEPSSEMTELTIGFAEMSLTQIACPACMGVSNDSADESLDVIESTLRGPVTSAPVSDTLKRSTKLEPSYVENISSFAVPLVPSKPIVAPTVPPLPLKRSVGILALLVLLSVK